MKLSEAIRLGAMLRQQADGALITERGSCALGAAYEAIGGKPRASNIFDGAYADAACDALSNTFGTMLDLRTLHPERRGLDSVAAVIVDLNDRYRWTREAIADWVETLEAAQATERSTDADACCSPTSVPLSVRTRA